MRLLWIAAAAIVRSPQRLRLAMALLCLWSCGCARLEVTPPTEQLSYGPFQRLRIYRPQAPVEHLALLLSGDGGWGSPLDSIAARLSAQGTLVTGIDVRELFATYEHEPQSCVAPGADLAQLARYLQQHYALADLRPVLIGHSAGATLAYIALAESPAGAFAGALTLSFCADLDLRKPLCSAPTLSWLPRSGGVRLAPVHTRLPAAWFALHGLDDGVCPVEDSRHFAAALPGAHFVPLPGVGHSFRGIGGWWPAFEDSWRTLTAGTRVP